MVTFFFGLKPTKTNTNINAQIHSDLDRGRDRDRDRRRDGRRSSRSRSRSRTREGGDHHRSRKGHRRNKERSDGDGDGNGDEANGQKNSSPPLSDNADNDGRQAGTGRLVTTRQWHHSEAEVKFAGKAPILTHEEGESESDDGSDSGEGPDVRSSAAPMQVNVCAKTRRRHTCLHTRACALKSTHSLPLA